MEEERKKAAAQVRETFEPFLLFKASCRSFTCQSSLNVKGRRGSCCQGESTFVNEFIDVFRLKICCRWLLVELRVQEVSVLKIDPEWRLQELKELQLWRQEAKKVVKLKANKDINNIVLIKGNLNLNKLWICYDFTWASVTSDFGPRAWDSSGIISTHFCWRWSFSHCPTTNLSLLSVY